MNHLPAVICRRSKRFAVCSGWAIVAAMLLVGTSGCPNKGGGGNKGGNSSSSGASSSSADEIVIGHYASLSGSEATFGVSTDNGIKLAVKEYNEASGINGKKIRLITYDDKGDSREAGSAVTRLITKDHVKAVMGEAASGLSLTAAPICQDNDVVMVTPSSTNPDVTMVGDRIFRVCFIDTFQGWVCAKFARESDRIKAKTAAILYNRSLAYSQGLQEEFEKWFKQMGGTIVSKQTYGAGDQDFSTQLTAIRGTNPDVVFIPGYYTDAGSIATQARGLGIEKPLLGGDGWDSDKLSEVRGNVMNNAYYSNHYSDQDPSPLVQDFIKNYQKEYGSIPDGLAALGYDGAKFLFDGMKRAKSLSGKDLSEALAATKDYVMATGTISMDANRNPVKAAVIIEMKDGKRTFVQTIQPEKK